LNFVRLRQGRTADKLAINWQNLLKLDYNASLL